MNVILRLAGCLLFLPLVIPFAVVTALTVIVVAVRWLIRGPDEAATDRILLNPVLCRVDDLPLLLFRAAERRSAT